MNHKEKNSMPIWSKLVGFILVLGSVVGGISVHAYHHSVFNSGNPFQTEDPLDDRELVEREMSPANPKFVQPQATSEQYNNYTEGRYETVLYPSKSGFPFTHSFAGSQCESRIQLQIQYSEFVAELDLHQCFEGTSISGGIITFRNREGDSWRLQVQHIGRDGIIAADSKIPATLQLQMEKLVRFLKIVPSQSQTDLELLGQIYERLDTERDPSDLTRILVQNLIAQVLRSTLFENRFQLRRRS